MPKIKKLAIVDTTFSRINMGNVAISTIQDYLKEFSFQQGQNFEIDFIRRTVPGFKDLAVACLNLFEQENCDMALACGWVGGMPIDEKCGHEAALAIAQAQLIARKHILHIFVHESEADHQTDANIKASILSDIANNRVIEHTKNAIRMLCAPDSMLTRAGQGYRQGGPSVGTIKK